MPHPFAFFLADGWGTQTLNDPVHQSSLTRLQRATTRMIRKPDQPLSYPRPLSTPYGYTLTFDENHRLRHSNRHAIPARRGH